MTEFKFPNQLPPAVDKRMGDMERKIRELESRLAVLETVDLDKVTRRGRPKVVNER